MRSASLLGTSCVASGVLLGALAQPPEASAAVERLTTIEVGSAGDQLGVDATPNTECRGPEAITFISASEYAILDTLNARIARGRVGQGVSATSSFTGVGYARDFLLSRGGPVVFDSMSRSVVLLGQSGAVEARLPVPPDVPLGGAARLAFSGNRELLLSTPGQQPVELGAPVGAPSIERLSGTAAMPDMTYEFRKTAENRAVLRLSGSPMPDLPTELRVESSLTIANAQVVSRDQEGRTYVLLEELSGGMGFEGPTRLLRYGRDGVLTGTVEVPVADYDCTPNRPIAVAPDGRVLFLGIRISQPVEILELRFEAPGTAPTAPGRQGARSGNVELLTADERMMRFLEEMNGGNGVEPLSARTKPITRARVLERAREARDLRWTVSAANYARPGLPSSCRPAIGEHWKRSPVLEGRIGQEVTAGPYRWGGFHPEVAHFRQRQKEGALASDVCTCRNEEYGYCVIDDAIGFDCSGFVSYSWGSSYHTTSGLSRISDEIGLADLRPGDAVNRAGRHVRLVTEVQRGERGIVIRVIESAVSCGRICDAEYTPGDLRHYRPIRFRGVQN